jgi:hypothetical protein
VVAGAAVVGACVGACRTGALVVRDEVGAVDGALDALAAVEAVVTACVGAADVVAADAAVVGAAFGTLLLALLPLVFPGRACAYPPASTTAPAVDATVIQPVVLRTRRSPRSRASARRRSSLVRCGMLGLLDRYGDLLDQDSPMAGSEPTRAMFRSGKDLRL